MFTGIVQCQVRVLSINTKNNLSRLVIAVDEHLLSSLEIGASVAINGVCLTAVSFGETDKQQHYIAFDIIDETLRVTNLASIKQGDKVNIERSLKVGDEIGGHMVSGHVHCQSSLVLKQGSDSNCALFFSCDEQWMKYILPKGFITINGTSLTVGKVEKQQFSVHLIPETLSRTNLGKLDTGAYVNLELDQQTMTIVNTVSTIMKDVGKLQTNSEL